MDCSGFMIWTGLLTWGPLASCVPHTGLSTSGTSGLVAVSWVRPAKDAGRVIREIPGLGCGLNGTEQSCIFRGECR